MKTLTQTASQQITLKLFEQILQLSKTLQLRRTKQINAFEIQVEHKEVKLRIFQEVDV